MDKKALDSVFKAYDIRGKVPDELDEEFYDALGRAYVTKFKPQTVVVGHDIRPQSFIFKKALIEGMLSMGCNVVDLGEIATEMLYFTVGEYSDIYDGGLIVTASHNPPGWNGCKMVGKRSTPIGKATGMFDLKDIMLSGEYEALSSTWGTLTDRFIYPEFRDKILSFLQHTPEKHIKIIVDAGNGIGGRLFDYVFGNLGLDATRMYFVPNGDFPNHVPDPMKDENVEELRKRVLQENADLGIAIDGDADRVVFLDKKGRKPDGVYTGVLLAKHLLQNSDNKKIVHDPRITWPFIKEASQLGAETFQSVAGHSNFKQKMYEKEALFGAEASSHFFYRDFYNCDSAMVTIALMLQMYFEGFELTEAVDYLFTKYPNSGEVNYSVNDADQTLNRLEDKYKDLGGEIEHVDGLSVGFSDWRFNMRKSNTQPLVRLNVEAETLDLVVEKFLEVEEVIGQPRDNIPTLVELR
jgi:phosphomannomutase